MTASFGLDIAKAPKSVLASLEPIIRFFSYHDAHPVALGMVLMEKFGTDWFDWEPEALHSEVISTFKATSISEHNWQKIQAFRTMLQASSPWTEWEAFENVIQALNNNVPDIYVLQGCSLSQLMAGVDIMSQTRKEGFSEEVYGYIAACAIEDGVTFLPTPLGGAQHSLSEPQYRCLDCGNVDDHEPSFPRCDVCTERFCDQHPLNGKANPALPDGCGRNIEVFLTRDPAGVSEQFEQWKGLDAADVDEEDIVQLQAAKLVVAHKYMMQRRQELVTQLEELKSWVTN